MGPEGRDSPPVAESFADRETLLEELPSGLAVAFAMSGDAEGVDRHGFAFCIPQLPADRQTLFEQLAGGIVLTLVARGDAHRYD